MLYSTLARHVSKLAGEKTFILKILWSMIASFGMGRLFRQMGMEAILYDCVSISSALSSCASLSALRSGKEIHGYGALISAESALIDMYEKCGNLDWAPRSNVGKHLQLGV